MLPHVLQQHILFLILTVIGEWCLPGDFQWNPFRRLRGLPERRGQQRHPQVDTDQLPETGPHADQDLEPLCHRELSQLPFFASVGPKAVHRHE